MYPITYEADFNPTPNRATTFFRLLLAIPWFIVGIFWGILFLFTHLFAWVAVIILGRYPQWLYDFNSGVIRYGIRTGSWVNLQTDEWPPFGIADDPNYPIRVNFPPPAASQSRWKALIRYILALPVLLVVAYGTVTIVTYAAFVAWLTIVFRGYMPEGVNQIIGYCRSFEARVLGYLAILTDDYPPVGLEAAKAAGTTPPPAAPAAPAV